MVRNPIEPRDYHLLRETISVPTCVIPNLFIAQEAIFISSPGPRIFIVIIITIIIIDYDYDYDYDYNYNHHHFRVDYCSSILQKKYKTFFHFI